MWEIRGMIKKWIIQLIFIFLPVVCKDTLEGLPLFYWKDPNFINFGDILSLKIVEKIIGRPIKEQQSSIRKKKLLAIGSILSFAHEGDIVWGSGINGKFLHPKHYTFKHLDIRAVRGPLTRAYLMKYLHLSCPEIYGDPALLMAHLFPEFKRSEHPQFDYIIIPHYSEKKYFPKSVYPNVVYPTDPWQIVIAKILDSKLVISSSLHGIVVAESFGIPARLLRITHNEPLFKYQDYYFGTGRSHVHYATSIKQALEMGGEKPYQCDLVQLYESFPFEFWPEKQNCGCIGNMYKEET